MNLLIKGGTVVDPANGFVSQADLHIEDGRIAAVISGKGRRPSKLEILDASGCIVAPGLIDMHVHLREPGFERKETIESGTKAAAAGGFTTIACMANTSPPADSRAVIELITNIAEKVGTVNVLPVATISKGGLGKELSEMLDLQRGGAVAFSDDGRPVESAELMRLALEYAKITGLPIIAHCEDLTLSAEGQMHEGYWSMMLGLKGIPSAAEEVMIARDLILAEHTGAKLHIAHVSSAGSVEFIRQAKARGCAVTAEVTPHHLALTDSHLLGFDTNFKVNPPLRTETDRKVLIQALREGTLEVIATDHAPHTAEDKDCEFGWAPFGISGIETAVPVLWTHLIQTGALEVEQLIACLSSNPARILGIPKGNLSPGAVADVTIIDPQATKRVDVAGFYSKGKNSPFHGHVLSGWPRATIVAGKVVMQGGAVAN